MAKKVNFTKITRKMIDKADTIVKTASISFRADIQARWPRLTGYSRGQWQTPVKISDASYEVTNPVEYSPVLWRGRHMIGEKSYGSLQMSEGGYPILAKTIRDLKQKLKGV